MLDEKGVIYIATGTRHVIEACNSALSLRKLIPNISISLFTNEVIDYYCFDKIIIIKKPQYNYIDKVFWMYSSPYVQTLFLDTDTYICSDFFELFDLLKMFDIAVAHASNRISSASSCYLIKGVPMSFPEMNTGVILFKKSSRMESFFSNWLALYLKDLHYYSENLKLEDKSLKKNIILPHDQPSFRAALFKSELRIATLSPEYNCRFSFPIFISGTVKILHGRHLSLSAIAEIINSKTERRIFVLDQGLIASY